MRRLTIIIAALLPLAGCTVNLGDTHIPIPTAPTVAESCQLCNHPTAMHDPGGTCARLGSLGRRCNCPGFARPWRPDRTP
jgi:hypothetical protein